VKVKVLLADDHTIVSEGLRAVLEPEFQIVAAVHDGRAAVKAAETLKPDIVVMDISLPMLNGIDAAREIRKAAPKVKIVFLTMHTDATYVQEAFEAGASGYVIKHSAILDLKVAIHRALLGKSYVTPSVAKDARSAARGLRSRKKAADLLTPRQRQVLQLVAEGRSAKEAAAILNVSPRTIEFHKYRLMQQLGLENTAQLLQFAIKHRIVSA
jgi:DNA-binding NarL/FixJ family response regulator